MSAQTGYPAPWHGATLTELVQGEANNFRLIRFVAASSVILSHSYVLTQGAAAIRQDLLKSLTGIDSGGLAVDVFFVTSGFLVCQSLLKRRNVIDFVLSRLLRITPALGVSVLLGALVLGPLVTELPVGAYFATRTLYSYIVIDVLSVSPFHERFALPGVFTHLPFPDVVNGPLWTLPWEIWMYGALLALFVLRMLGRPFAWFLGAVLLGYAVVALGWWKPGVSVEIALRFLAFFFCGAGLAAHGAPVRIGWPILAAATLIFALASWATQSTLLLPPWLAYAVIFLAYAPALVVRRLSHGPDYSYGMYIYAYMVQQTLVWAFGPHAPLVNAAAALVLTLPLAMASWHWIEEPALTFKQRLRRRHLQAARGTLA